MSIRYLDLSGAVNFWTNIKNFILSKIPTKTSELTNDSGFLTQHQSLSNYVTLNSEQTITGKKLFTASSIQLDSVTSMYGSTMFIDTSASAPRGEFPAETHRVGRIYIGDGTSYNGSWFIIDPIIDTDKAFYRMVTTNPDNTDSTRFSIVWDSTKEGVRRRRNISMGDLLPTANNTYNLGADDQKWDIGYIHNLIGSNKEDKTEDVNNYYSTTSGSHMTFYTTSNGGTKLSNVPAAVNTHLESRTIRYLSSSDWIIEQICHNSFGLYYRKGTNGTWEDWKTFAFTNSNITGTASNVTGTVAIANGGTGATTRLNAVKALTNEAVGTPTHFLTITTNWGKAGYTTVAQAKTVLGITGDIVSHNASEFLTSHQSLSSCVKNSVVNSQTIKSTGITRGTAPSSAQTFGIAFSDKNNKYIGNIYGVYATNKATFVGLYAYKGTTTENGDNASVRVGYDASGNVYTSAPTPATTDNSTQIATTAFVKAQGYLTSHQSLANYLTKTTNVSEMGRYIDLHYDNATAKYDYDVRLYVDSQGTAKGGGSFKISAASAYAPAPASDANDTRIATTAWVNSKGYLTSHQSLANYVTTNTDQSISGIKSHSKHISILGDYIGNEFSTNARTCLYLKSNRDTDGQSGIYFSKYRQNRAQGALTGSDLVSLTLDVLENSVRTNGCIDIEFRYFENDVPTKIYVIPKASVTSYMGTASNPWTNAYITNLILNGNAFDPASVSGNIGDIVFARAYYSAIDNLTMTAAGDALALIRIENKMYVEDRNNQSLSGTWKFLGSTIPTVTSGNASSTCAGVWKRIA